MNRVLRRFFVRTLVAIGLLLALGVTQVLAGGPCRPVCPPPMCGPSMCPPPMCGPAPCPPPMCGPAACPPPCPPPRTCEMNPLKMILTGTVRLVAGAVALPFRLVDCVVTEICRPKACRPPACPPPMCGPAPCAPPVCPPPMCGPGYGAPVGYGMGAMPPPTSMGMGKGAPRHFKPMAKKSSVKTKLFADQSEGIFGNYW